MKRFSFILLSFLVLFFLANTDLHAQGKGKGKVKSAKSSVKTHGPPPWAPAHGYRAKTRYVYFKDYDVYYDHQRGVYITLNGGNWAVTTRLPSVLQRVDLKAAVKVDLEFDGDNPQKYHKVHRRKYPK